MDKVGLAVIGSTGIIGRVHIEAMRGLESCRLVGINARRQEPLRQQADELGTRLYPTLDDVLADDEVDAVVIATPHPSHMEITTERGGSGQACARREAAWALHRQRRRRRLPRAVRRA